MEDTTTIYKSFTITLSNDPYGDNPTNDGNFAIAMRPHLRLMGGNADELYYNYDGKLTPQARTMLRSGQLWPITYTEHGLCSYDLAQTATGGCDGFIELSSEYVRGTSKSDRKQYAESDLEQYTAWANGECYYLTVTDPYGDNVEDIAEYSIVGDPEWAIDEAKRLIDNYGINYASKAKTAREVHK